jgi:hypothetical protein
MIWPDGGGNDNAIRRLGPVYDVPAIPRKMKEKER